MLIQEEYVNATTNTRFGSSEPFEPWTEDIGKLFKSLQKEYGRCVSSVRVDTPNGPPKRVGWVFQGMQRYEDTNEPYLREVWVTLLEQPDDVKRTRHYKELS